MSDCLVPKPSKSTKASAKNTPVRSSLFKSLKTLRKKKDAWFLCPKALRTIQKALLHLMSTSTLFRTFKRAIRKPNVSLLLLKSSKLALQQPMWVCFFSNKNESERCLFGLPLLKIISTGCRHAYGFLSAFSPHLKNSTSTLSALLQNPKVQPHDIRMTSDILIMSLPQSARSKHLQGVYVLCKSLLRFAQNIHLEE